MQRGRRSLARTDEWNMHADVVSLLQRFFQRHVLNSRLILLQRALMAKIHELLDCLYELLILVCRVIAQDVHVEARAFFDHRLADATCPYDRDVLASDLISKKGQKRVPGSPAFFAHLQ